MLELECWRASSNHEVRWLKVSRRIPDLQFDLFSIDVDHTCSKLHTYCEVVHGLEPLVGKLKEET